MKCGFYEAVALALVGFGARAPGRLQCWVNSLLSACPRQPGNRLAHAETGAPLCNAFMTAGTFLKAMPCSVRTAHGFRSGHRHGSFVR